VAKKKKNNFGHLDLVEDDNVHGQYHLTGCGRTRISKAAMEASLALGGPHVGFTVKQKAPVAETSPEDLANTERAVKPPKKAARRSAGRPRSKR